MDKKKKSGNQRSKKYLKNKSKLSDAPSRIPCNCEATDHPLVNNCINCGRIVCLKEGPGPCFFCGNMVCYNDEELNLINELNIGNKSTSENKTDETLKLRDKLLEYDKNCASRTNVIDDECDYFQTNNKWLSKSELEQWEKLSSEVHDQRHKSRLQQKVSIDLTGKIHTDEEEYLSMQFQGLNTIRDEKDSKVLRDKSYYNEFHSLKGANYVGTEKLPSNATTTEDDDCFSRVQDQEFIKISDRGMCISVDQPYASLIASGIKKYEELTLYTAHRGRLWIASTSNEPVPEDIKFLEETYQALHNEKIEFPKSYPVGCVIGCVDVANVLSREEYVMLHPGAKIGCRYVFVFENGFELPTKPAVQGKDCLYKLDKLLHRSVMMCLEGECRRKGRS